MSSLNKVQIIGRLGKDPEVRTIPSGNKVANFSIATSEKFKDKSGQLQEKTEWHNIVIWGKLAEIIEKYVRKGSLIYLEGKLETRSWDDQATGQKKYKTEINCNIMQMLGSKSDNQQGGYSQPGPTGGQPTPQASSPDPIMPPPEDSLPF